MNLAHSVNHARLLIIQVSINDSDGLTVRSAHANRRRYAAEMRKKNAFFPYEVAQPSGAAD